MIKLIDEKMFYIGGSLVNAEQLKNKGIVVKAEEGYTKTIAYRLLAKHNCDKHFAKGDTLKLAFDCLCSHDITYVGIIETAKASGLKQFPLPYILTNCHNSLCAVGGTINEDDHLYGLTSAKKYGGIYVPKHVAVIHTYMREMMAGCGKMILGSDSHTRYGALGCMAIGEGGGELVKQLLKLTYDVKTPDVIAVELKGNVRMGVGPQDVALAIIGAVFKNGFVKNKVLEFVGQGIASLPQEFRNGIDVMTTETACLSSIWQTDAETEAYYQKQARFSDYKRLIPDEGACYDGAVVVDLNKIEPMIALPFHPSNVYKLQDVIDNPYEILSQCEKEGKELTKNPSFSLTSRIKNGKIYADQGVIAGCAGGTFDNIFAASEILKDGSVGSDAFNLSVYCGSVPTYSELMKEGALYNLTQSGVIIKTAFCGPCFGAGDVPSNNGFSIRHTTRNFENREGSKPQERQIASVALMDARSIAQTARNGGRLSSCLGIDYTEKASKYFEVGIYQKSVYQGFLKGDEKVDVVYGPNIAPWPSIPQLPDNLVVEIAASIYDPVTTTDELIPSGETSSFRSNPMRLAEFTLSRKDANYVKRAKAIGNKQLCDYAIKQKLEGSTLVESAIFAIKPGDGSAREQAVSCQRVLKAGCNFAREYATKRYRSNLINWGVIPFESTFNYEVGDVVILANVKQFIKEGQSTLDAVIMRGNVEFETVLSISPLTPTEREIILEGCLINYYNSKSKK